MNSLEKRLANYQEVMHTGEYLQFAKNRINVKFVGKFYRFEQATEVIQAQLFSPHLVWLTADTHDKVDVTIIHSFSRAITGDGFSIEIGSAGIIEIQTNNLRGFYYAQEALAKCFISDTHGIYLPVLTIKHTPSFTLRGVIEGFYGEPWTLEERIDCIKFVHSQQMNTYMYAPKDDTYQRKDWRLLYPEDRIEQFKRLIEKANQYQVDFWYMISPGNDIEFTKPKEVAVLTTKLQQMINIGIRHFGLLLDDIDYHLKGQQKQRFQTAAHAHAFLIQQVDEYLATQLADYQLVACPTEYDNAYDSDYLSVLNEILPKHIPLFWTGPATLAPQISQADLQTMQAVYQRPLIIWDNVPVNDYLRDKERIFLSPYANRSPYLSDSNNQVQGIVGNPMSQWELSKLTLSSMSKYLWNSQRYTAFNAWQQTIKEYTADEQLSEALRIFAWHNPNHYMQKELAFPIKQALDRLDKPTLTSILVTLNQAIECLKTLPNQAFQQAVAPWFDRAEQDWLLWEAILADHHPEIKHRATSLKNAPVRLGSNIPLNYLQRKTNG